ncbi:hypothetical protein C0992_003515 [Termitomyces sp. T32_za158]|nr:hypothetical protein C0992_003515 [Termitomyces sp. T32_za158]
MVHTLLEKIKTLSNDKPGLPPDKVAPTIGQNTGTITLPSSILQFWNLSGQRGMGGFRADAVLTAPQILGVPLLLLANKQDALRSLSVEEIRHDYEDWYQRKLESARRDTRYGQPESERVARKMRIASLEVLGVSALEGTGVREAVDWLFIIRVQNSRR